MADNWISYDDQRPPKVLCEFWDVTGVRFVANPKDFGQMFNIGGLKWRLTGIGHKELALNPHLGTQPFSVWQEAANSAGFMGSGYLSGISSIGGSLLGVTRSSKTHPAAPTESDRTR